MSPLKPAICPAIVNLSLLCRTLDSAAYFRATADHTFMGREDFDEVVLINLLAQAITGEPGFATVDQNYAAIEQEKRVYAKILLTGALNAAAVGPGPFTDYLQRVDNERRINVMRINDVFNRISGIQKKIEQRLTFAMHTALVLRTAATIGLVVTPLAPLVIPALELSLAEGVTLILVSAAYKAGTQALEPKSTPNAPPNAIAFDINGTVKQIARDGTLEASGRLADASSGDASVLLIDAQKQIDVLSRRLGQKLADAKRAQLLRRLDRSEEAVSSAGRSLQIAKWGARAASTFNVVFAAVDVYDAIDDARKKW
ncbi:MAG: hypothetical protein KGM15_08140 [Pseudomonadota bacterium]|nr:hypothetical protein [Pseudomonadota bacterium]